MLGLVIGYVVLAVVGSAVFVAIALYEDKKSKTEHDRRIEKFQQLVNSHRGEIIR